ncbi:MAG TPA: M4 family metallopeptidase [Thermoleophilaceae bacterium]|nr:M4 family metallopeptidase [Thermoleophilaceae bacterium]
MLRACCLLTVGALLTGATAESAAAPRSEPLHGRTSGFLTRPSNERPTTVALDYVSEHPGTFGLDSNDLSGLRLVRSYRFAGGAAHLQWSQVYRGIPVFGAGLRANVAADGRLINVGEGAVPDPGVGSTEPRLSALDALLAAARAAGAPVAPGRPGRSGGAERATRFTSGDRASLTLYGGDRLAWRVLLRADSTHVYDAVVDATSGATLYRVNLVKEVADDALVYQNYPGASVGGAQVVKSLTPWLSETPRTRLYGPNAWVYNDPDDAIDGFGTDPAPVPSDEIPPDGSGEWTVLQQSQAATQAGLGQHCPPTNCTWSNFDTSMSWTQNLSQAGSQLFYYVNTYHDHLRNAPGIGFSSGNFEGADRVQAQVDDGSKTETITPFEDYPDCDHINNAYVVPVPDGMPLFMQIYLWSNACTSTQLELNDVNAADDALIVYHEYTHGMTNRLVTDGAGYPAMNGAQPGAMDEALADFYALDLLVAQGMETDTAAPGELVAGRYENDHLRTQAWDCPVGAAASACPGNGTAGSGGYTYGDLGKISGLGPEVHADGEIFVETLWDLRNAEIAAHGAANGLARTRALVTDGLRLAPANPTFLGMRNAILQADLNRGYGDRGRIWAVFAHRGMGYRATTTGNNDTAPIQDFSLPPVVHVDPPPPPDTIRPRLSGTSLTKRRIRVGARAAFKFTLSEVSTVELSFSRARPGRRYKGRCRPATRKLRKRPRCTRYLAAGSIVKINMSAGAHSVGFAGRLRGRALPLGAYKVTLRATDPAGNRSSSVTTTLRIVRR